MLYDGIAIAVAVIGGLLLIAALKTLFRRGWLLSWLKGSLGIVTLMLAAIVGFMALDVFSYTELLEESSVATISFEKLEEQRYRAVLVSADGVEQQYELRGDQWQLDARIFKWSPTLAKIGFKPGYRLDRLAGRYYSLEEERFGERTVYALSHSQQGVDVWRWFKAIDHNVPWLDALYGSATFVPMNDGALFEVSLSNTGLLSRPLNEPAKVATRRWQ